MPYEGSNPVGRIRFPGFSAASPVVDNGEAESGAAAVSAKSAVDLDLRN